MYEGDDGPSDIYVINSDGTGQRQVTDNADGCEARPTWSPDGQQLMYIAADDCGDTSSVFVMDGDGSNQRLLVDEDALWPDWAPDGGHILYTP